jgi:hypothetical protein
MGRILSWALRKSFSLHKPYRNADRRTPDSRTLIFQSLIRFRPELHHVDDKERTVNNQAANNHKDAPRFTRVRQKRLALCLWAILAVGLLVEMAAPRLKIENNAFVMPPINDARGATLRPAELVRRERWMQAAAGLLTLGGAVALGIYYRRTLASALKG